MDKTDKYIYIHIDKTDKYIYIHIDKKKNYTNYKRKIYSNWTKERCIPIGQRREIFQSTKQSNIPK